MGQDYGDPFLDPAFRGPYLYPDDIDPVYQLEDGFAAHPDLAPAELQVPGVPYQSASAPDNVPSFPSLSSDHSTFDLPSLTSNHDQWQQYCPRIPQENHTDTLVRYHLDVVNTAIAGAHRELDLRAIRQRLHTLIVDIDSLLVGRRASNRSPSLSQETPDPKDPQDSGNSNGHTAQYRCWLCHPTPIFTGKGTFRRHITSTHRSAISYRCYDEGCGEIFFRRDNFAEHLRVRHGKGDVPRDLINQSRVSESPTSCDICPATVNSFDEYFKCMYDHCRLPSESSSVEGDYGATVPYFAPPGLYIPVTGTSHETPLLGLGPGEEAESTQNTRFNTIQGVAHFIEPQLSFSNGDRSWDSGYAEYMHEDQKMPQNCHLGQTEVILEAPSPDLHDISPHDKSRVTESHDNDGKIIYPDASSVSEPAKESYIAELAEYIAKATRLFRPNKEVLERISEVLPLLLRVFALSLGHAKSSQVHHDVMVFLYQHRMDIGAALMSRLCERTGQEAEDRGFERGASERTPLDTVKPLWYRKLSPEPNAELHEPTEAMDNRGHGYIDSKKTDTNDDIKLPQMDIYRNLIQNSPSYSWLLASLRRECVLAPSEPNTMEHIREMVLSVLPVDPGVSRRRPTQVLEVFMRMKWDPVAFYIQQEYTENPKEAIEGAITLTGSHQTTQAITCSQYMNQTWPSTGANILDLVISLVSSNHNREVGSANTETGHLPVVLPNGTTVQAFRKALQGQTPESFVVWVKVCGLADSIAEVGEQLAWLGCALRSSPADSGIAYCRPVLKRLQEQPLLEDLKINSPHVCEIDFDIRMEDGNTESVDGRCWRGLFRNPVVAEGYPTPRRPEPDPGLEIPLEILAGLSQARRTNTFDGKTVLKGFSVMLIPTKFSNDIVMWHMLHADRDKRLSYLEAESFSPISLSGADLESSRHILGWCSDMKLYAGTSQAQYTVQASRLQYPTGESALANVCISIGHLIRGGTPFSIGTKDLHPRRSCYVTKMRWISQRFLVLWDVEAKRGWLVNGASALLHLLRASLEQEKRGKFGRRSLINPEELQEAAEPYGHESALDVLLSEFNLQLKVYAEKDGFICLQDRIEDFYGHLETIFDYQLRSDYSKVPRSCLDGWDFHDLATEKDPVHPRRATIDPEGRSWIDFTRSIHAVTLLGRDYGEIIRPTSRICPSWASLPKGKSYLAASLADLRSVMEAYGGDPYETPVRLTNNLVWHTTGSIAMECRCLERRDGNHSDLAQVILPSILSRGLEDSFAAYGSDSGAVFFGFNGNHQWYWKDHGYPSTKETAADHASTPEKISKHMADSGFDSPGTTLTELGSGLTESMSQEFSNDPLDTSSEGTSWLSSSQERRGILAKDYTVGIICALPLEFKAVRALFDETYPPCVPDADTHAYAQGRIGEHRVVAAGLPKGGYGTTSAAVVACNMSRSFPSIEFCMLVGIGGGVPSKNHDIRLGDIVVSTPNGPHTGVLAYDSVKVLESTEILLNACLSRPSRTLLSAITALTSETQASLWELQEVVDRITESCPEYEHPGLDQDILFASEYTHEANERRDSCEKCDLERRVVRTPRTSTQPQIHYGLIASGYQLMRSAHVRDRMSQKYDVLCFEMEGAGIMDTFPSLVIRGICDYADSHKNKRWQEYAAAAAAAYVKLLLSRVRAVPEYDVGGSLLTGCKRKLCDGIEHSAKRQLVEHGFREL